MSGGPRKPARFYYTHFALAGLTAVIYFLFLWDHIRIIRTSTVQFDDAFIANVAKNLAGGHGYSASYYGIQPFHLEITTGPTLVVPTALLIALFGNQYWVPNLAYSLIVVVLTIGVLAMLHRRVRGRAFTIAALILGLALYALGRQEIGLLGEVPAALWIVTAALVAVSSDRDSLSALELAGLFVGFAMLAKVVATLALPAFLFVILTTPVFAGRRTASVRGFLVGVITPLLAFEIWKLASFRWNFDAWSRLTGAELDDIIGPHAELSGSGTVYRLINDPLLVVENIVNHSKVLASWIGGTRNPAISPIWYGGWLPTVAGASAVALAIWSLRQLPRERNTDRLVAAATALFVTAGLCLAWWLALAPMGWVRHLMPGAICLLCALAIAIGTIGRYDLSRSALSSTLLVIALAPNLVNISVPFGTYSDLLVDIREGLPKRERLLALQRTVAFLTELKTNDPDAQMVGCGWSHNPSLEYLMPGFDHFRDCILVRARTLEGRRLILVRGEYFNQLNLPDIRRFQEWCEQRVLFQALSWVVSECPGPPPAWP